MGIPRRGPASPRNLRWELSIELWVKPSYIPIFFALAQRRQEIERRREEGRQVGRTEGREELIRELVDRGVSLPDDVRKGIEKDGKG